MIKLIDVFILGITNSFSVFPPKIVDYDAVVKEVEHQLDLGMHLDSINLTNDKLNIFNDLSNAYNQLTNESSE